MAVYSLLAWQSDVAKEEASRQGDAVVNLDDVNAVIVVLRHVHIGNG